jgi:hypothetical protein
VEERKAAAKNLAAAISISKGEGRKVKTLYHHSENHKPFYPISSWRRSEAFKDL